ncbi:Flp pilus assembly protein CpaB [Pseudaeromonas paramecii]|uniref:Flp pilus assembly protein CpaB n=1 Tax=Pseudaeromonas paramecii TaxID=2138166 RepID=A0ABP8Q9E1_9GAMM
MKGKVIAMLVVSLAMGGGALWLADSWLKRQRGPVNPQGDQVAVVVAAQLIPLGTQVESKHVHLLTVPKALQPENSFSTLEDAIGRIAQVDLLPAEILRAERLARPGEGNLFASLITPEKRAVTIRVNDVVGVAGFLLPGNYVDVLASVELDGKNNVKTTTVLENIRVLAVDQTARTADNKPVIVRAVTLEVTPQEAEKLMTETTRGTIQLALRNPEDVAPNPTPVAAAPQLAAVTPPPCPAPKVVRSGGGQSVTLIKGVSVSQTRVSQ